MDDYCLICFKSLRKESSLRHMFYIDDVICENCRSQLKKKITTFNFQGNIIEGIYPYQGNIKDLLLQYKEMYDEALFPIFLYQDKKYLTKKYKDYVLVPVPSSEFDYHRRGFHHVSEMFSILELPIVDLFEKTSNVNLKNADFAQRQKISDVIKLKEGVTIPNKKILLIDDVCTTKASLMACFNLIGRCDTKSLVVCYTLFTKK